MTIDELDSLRIVPDPGNIAPWLKDDDPRGYYDADGRLWRLMRVNGGELVRFRPATGLWQGTDMLTATRL